MMKTARQIALDVLCRVEEDGAYSAIAFDKAAQAAGLKPQDTAFAAALVYGVLERRITLDWRLNPYLKKGVKALDCAVRNALRIGVYELCHMESVPDRAAVNEAVSLVRYAKKASAAGMVNAILRGFIRDEKPLRLPDRKKQFDRHLSVKYGIPEWLIKQWRTQYGAKEAEHLAKATLSRPPLYARVNTLKTSADALIETLRAEGVQAQKHQWLDNCLILSQTGSIDALKAYHDGLFYIQDLSSQVCAYTLGAKPGDTVLDICAAPGSKSFTTAQYMENRGTVLSFDLYEHKCRLIEQGAKRLGISVIQADIRDGATDSRELPMADRILCDVPCSGLGIVRRKPEIRFRSEESVNELPELQYRILCNAARFLKPDGVLIYSTCTTNKNENEAVVKRFLKENNWASPLQFTPLSDTIDIIENFMATLLPHRTGSDGFFFAALTRKEEPCKE